MKPLIRMWLTGIGVGLSLALAGIFGWAGLTQHTLPKERTRGVCAYLHAEFQGGTWSDGGLCIRDGRVVYRRPR